MSGVFAVKSADRISVLCVLAVTQALPLLVPFLALLEDKPAPLVQGICSQHFGRRMLRRPPQEFDERVSSPGSVPEKKNKHTLFGVSMRFTEKL